MGVGPAAVLLAAIGVALVASGCVPNESGGYAAQCNLSTVDGWQPGAAWSYDKQLPSGRLSVGTHHLYYDHGPSALIELSALVIPKDGKTYPDTMFDPRTAWLAADGVRVPADVSLREDPFMKDTWRHGGAYPVPANMNDGTPLVLTFPVRFRPGAGFVLHLGQFVVDGKPVAVPDIPYCFIAHKTTWTPFHG